MRVLFSLLILLLFAPILPTLGNTYYVRLDGSDSNTGKKNNYDGAWGTLNYATGRLRGGDT